MLPSPRGCCAPYRGIARSSSDTVTMRSPIARYARIVSRNVEAVLWASQWLTVITPPPRPAARIVFA